MGVKMIKTSVPDEEIRRFASGLCDSCLRKVMARATFYIVARHFWLILLAAQAGVTLRTLVYSVQSGTGWLGFGGEAVLFLVWSTYYRRRLLLPYRIAKRDSKFFKEEFDLRRGRFHG